MDYSNALATSQKGRRGNTIVPPEDIEKYTKFYETRLAAYGYDDKEPVNRRIIARYCAKYYSGAVTKGLALVGDTGRGKTFAMRILSKMFGWRMYDSCELVEQWQRLGVKDRGDMWSELKGYDCATSWPDGFEHCWKDIVIDDIGTEPTLNDFGTKLEVIEQIVNRRVKEYENNQAFTFLTCNLTQTNKKMDENSIQGRYGKRMLSRINQICYVVRLEGPDRRME